MAESVFSNPAEAASSRPTPSPSTTSSPDVGSARTMGRGSATDITWTGAGHGSSGEVARASSSVMGKSEMLGAGVP